MAVEILIGSFLGTMSGLGIGGGSLLVLYLTQIKGYDQPAARGINLLFFIPAAIISCLFRCKQGTLPMKKLWPGMIAGCIFAVLFTWAGARIETALLRKLFGILLVITGIRELCIKNQERPKEL